MMTELTTALICFSPFSTPLTSHLLLLNSIHCDASGKRCCIPSVTTSLHQKLREDR